MCFSTDLVHAGRWPVRSLNSRGWGWQWCWAGSGQVEGMERWVFADPLRSFPHRCQANRCQSIHPETWQLAPHSLGTEFAVENREQLKFIYIDIVYNIRFWSIFLHFENKFSVNHLRERTSKPPESIKPKSCGGKSKLYRIWVLTHNSFIDYRMIFIASRWQS